MILNNKILRIVQFKKKLTNTIKLYEEFNTLPLNLLFRYKLLIFTHTWYYYRDSIPRCFNNIFIEKSTVFKYSNRYKYNLYTVRCKSDAYMKSFKFVCVKMWNALPINIKSIKSLRKFKKLLLKHLIMSASNQTFCFVIKNGQMF